MIKEYIYIYDDDGYDNIDTDSFDSNCNNDDLLDNNNDNDDDNNKNLRSIYLIQNEQIDSDDPNISEFLKFCIKKGLFDNTFYDLHNTFSVVATKLPQTFEKLCSGKNDIFKNSFIKTFKSEYGYTGDISFIYNYLDSEKKGFITWDEFSDFFLPFVQYITI